MECTYPVEYCSAIKRNIETLVEMLVDLESFIQSDISLKEKSEGEVARSCTTLSDPMDCSPPGSSIHGFSRQEYWSGVPLPCYLLRGPANHRGSRALLESLDGGSGCWSWRPQRVAEG